MSFRVETLKISPLLVLDFDCATQKRAIRLSHQPQQLKKIMGINKKSNLYQDDITIAAYLIGLKNIFEFPRYVYMNPAAILLALFLLHNEI